MRALERVRAGCYANMLSEELQVILLQSCLSKCIGFNNLISEPLLF